MEADLDISTRVTPGHGYLEALLSDKVEVETTRISKVTEAGILMEDGRFHQVDVIITATGYDTSYVPRFPLIGLNGVNLTERWRAEGPKAYLGLTAPSIPNYFSKSSTKLCLYLNAADACL